jgi:AraC-like DNA-binding protein
MEIQFEERPSDSPFVETIWHSQSEQSNTFISLAVSHWMMVVTKQEGKTIFTVRGPETKASLAYCPPNAEFFGIFFKLGTLMPNLPASNLLDRQDANLPEAGSNSFWLNGSAWEYPNYDNMDTFIDRLVREGLIIREPAVGAALLGHTRERSLRSVQRRFLRATGLTHSYIHQIERARHATTLLKKGVSIMDTVEMAGYSDQPHLTRSLKHLMGQTPLQILQKESLLGFIRDSVFQTPVPDDET